MSTPALSLDSALPLDADGGAPTAADLRMAAAAPLLAAGSVDTDPLLRVIGSAMLAVGTLALLTGAILDRPISGGIVAAAVFTVIMGLAIRFPTMLQDGTMTDDNRPAYSAIRVVVLMVMGTFVMLTVKVGWSTERLELLKVDQSWAWILGVVLGGKVVQGFSEGNLGLIKK